MNDVEKARFNAALDLIQWLDTRIAQQVEHQLGQRLAQEREYWRCSANNWLRCLRRSTRRLSRCSKRITRRYSTGSNGFLSNPRSRRWRG
jgi:hypothetical protein